MADSSNNRDDSLLERLRLISIEDAADFKNVSVDTFKRHYSRLIRQVSPRRIAVRVADLIDDE